MSFKKYQKVEQLDLFTDAQNEIVNGALRKSGKTSYSQLDEQERKEVQNRIEDLKIPE